MGINGFSKFFSEVLVTKDVSELSNKVVIVDAIYVIYKYCIAIRNSGKDYINKDGDLSSHLFAIFNLAIFLLKNNITPIFVFDGHVPDIKKNTINDRKKRKIRAMDDLEKDITDKNEYIKNFKKSFHLDELHYYECQLLLNYLGISYIVAPEEADSQCAVLSRLSNYNIGGIISDDSDILVFGGTKLLKNFNIKNKSFGEYDINNIHSLMIEKANNINNVLNMNSIHEISHSDFIKYCILLGGDYIESIKYLKYDKIFELLVKSNFEMNTFFTHLKDYIKNNERFDNFKEEDFNEYKIRYFEKFNKVYDYYLKAKVFDPNDIDISLKEIEKNNVIQLLTKIHDFDINYINSQLNSIIQKNSYKFIPFKSYKSFYNCAFEQSLKNRDDKNYNIDESNYCCR